MNLKLEGSCSKVKHLFLALIENANADEHPLAGVSVEAQDRVSAAAVLAHSP